MNPVRVVTLAIFSLFFLTSLLDAPLSASDWTQSGGNTGHNSYVDIRLKTAGISKIWQTETTTSLMRTSEYIDPVIDDTGVYISLNPYYWSLDTGHKLVKRDRHTGKVIWSVNVPSTDGLISAPSLAGNQVLVHGWGHSSGLNPPSNPSNPAAYPRMLGFNSATGALTFRTIHPGQWDSGSRPATLDNQAFAAGGYYGGLDAYSLPSGARQWSAPMAQVYGWEPTVDQSYVYTFQGHTLYAHARGNGNKSFEYAVPGGSFNSYLFAPILDGNGHALVQPFFGNAAGLSVLDLEGPSAIWSRPDLGSRYRPSFGGGRVTAVSSGDLHVLDASTGSDLFQWGAPDGAPIKGAVVLTNDFAFVQTLEKTGPAFGADYRLVLYQLDLTQQSHVASYAFTFADPDPHHIDDTIEPSLALDDGLLISRVGDIVTAFSLVPEPTSVSQGLMAMILLSFCVRSLADRSRAECAARRTARQRLRKR